MSKHFASTLETRSGKENIVNSVAELLQSAADPSVKAITVAQDLEALPEFHLAGIPRCVAVRAIAPPCGSRIL